MADPEPPKRELSEKELEAAPALLMLLARSDQSATGTPEEAKPLSSATAPPSSVTSPTGASLPPHPSPTVPQPVSGLGGSAPTGARLSIYSLLNQEDNDVSGKGGTDRSCVFSFSDRADPDDRFFATRRASMGNSASSTPTSPVSSPPLIARHSSAFLPPFSSLLSSSSAFDAPHIPSSLSAENVGKGIKRKARSRRKNLNASSPSPPQSTTKEGRKRKAAKSAPASNSANKSDRRTKKQRQIELLQSVNSGQAPSFASSNGPETSNSDDAAAAPSAASQRAFIFSSPRDQGEAARPGLSSMEGTRSAPDGASSGGNSSSSSGPLALGESAGTPLKLPSSLSQLQQLLPSPLPSSIDHQRVMQLTLQLHNTSAPSEHGNAFNANNQQHSNRFGDKKRERRDSFSFTYPSRGETHQQSAPSAPLPQHQQEFLQQLLQQIHHKKQGADVVTQDLKADRAQAVDSSSSQSSPEDNPQLSRLAFAIPPSISSLIPPPETRELDVSSDAPEPPVETSETMDAQVSEEINTAEDKRQPLLRDTVANDIQEEGKGPSMEVIEEGAMERCENETRDETGGAGDSFREPNSQPTGLHLDRTAAEESLAFGAGQVNQDSCSNDDQFAPTSNDLLTESGDDDLLGGRRKASPQQMAILEQICSTVGFRSFSSGMTLNFTASSPSLSFSSTTSISRSFSTSSTMPRSRRSSVSSPRSFASLDMLLPSIHRRAQALRSSSDLPFTISSPNLPSFFLSSFSHLKSDRGEHCRNSASDNDGSVREVESSIIESRPNTALPFHSNCASSISSRSTGLQQRQPSPLSLATASSPRMLQEDTPGGDAQQSERHATTETRAQEEAFGALRPGPEDGSMLGAY